MNYISKHAQWRRDLLRGNAALAQDLYAICDLIAEMLKIITDKPQKPLSVFLDEGSPIHNNQDKFAGGLDFKAVESATQKLNAWLRDEENLRLIEQLKASLPKEQIFDIEKELKSAETVEAALELLPTRNSKN